MKRLLVVDDEPGARLSFRTALETEGYEISETGTAVDALAKFNTQLFDLAILDMRMPELDGLELLKAIRKEGILIPVVIVTAFSDIPSAVRAMKLGAIDFLEKPMRPEDLRKVVSEIILRHESTRRVMKLDDAASHITAAKRLINRCEFTAAKAHVIRALRLDEKSVEAFNLAGVLAEILEDCDRAKKLYGRAIAINKHFEPAQQNMRRRHRIIFVPRLRGASCGLKESTFC